MPSIQFYFLQKYHIEIFSPNKVVKSTNFLRVSKPLGVLTNEFYGSRWGCKATTAVSLMESTPPSPLCRILWFMFSLLVIFTILLSLPDYLIPYELHIFFYVSSKIEILPFSYVPRWPSFSILYMHEFLEEVFPCRRFPL